MLPGATLVYLDDQSKTADAKEGEGFSTAGQWTWLGGRGSVPGTYVIQSDGAVCVIYRWARSCRFLYVDATRQIYLPAFGGSALVRPVAVRRWNHPSH